MENSERQLTGFKINWLFWVMLCIYLPFYLGSRRICKKNDIVVILTVYVILFWMVLFTFWLRTFHMMMWFLLGLAPKKHIICLESMICGWVLLCTPHITALLTSLIVLTMFSHFYEKDKNKNKKTQRFCSFLEIAFSIVFSTTYCMVHFPNHITHLRKSVIKTECKQVSVQTFHAADADTF